MGEPLIGELLAGEEPMLGLRWLAWGLLLCPGYSLEAAWEAAWKAACDMRAAKPPEGYLGGVPAELGV